MNLLLFTFRGSVSEKIFDEIKDAENKLVIESSQVGIEGLIEHVRKTKPTHIVGMGEYGGRDQDLIRIETKCNENFRNNKIPDVQVSDMKPFLLPGGHSKFSEGSGNSWCNLVSVKIINLFPQIEYTFLHIPKAFDLKFAKGEIEEMLSKAKI